jgi:hypothetical protein
MARGECGLWNAHHLSESPRPARRLLPALERLGTRAWVSRITTSRARPNSGWFTEGFGTTDLQEVKALLEELGDQRPYTTRR